MYVTRRGSASSTPARKPFKAIRALACPSTSKSPTNAVLVNELRLQVEKPSISQTSIDTVLEKNLTTKIINSFVIDCIFSVPGKTNLFKN
ncbi:hypothetical protein K0M31_012208 [Melipona bicolor]|uniref:Uncharacterized protein n=1 Tax=Melipona bicolor TaxID=60889 RepID=A0AA40FK52_9HYME|nr:hypothetical protein K0M31_012208 [Melipona bicolor]